MTPSWNPEELESLVVDLETEASKWITRESVLGILLFAAGVLIGFFGPGNFGIPAALLGMYSLGVWDGKRSYGKRIQNRLEDKCGGAAA